VALCDISFNWLLENCPLRIEWYRNIQYDMVTEISMKILCAFCCFSVVNRCLVQLGFCCFIVCRMFYFSAILCNISSFPNHQSNWSPLSFCSTTFQNVLSSSDLLSELSKLPHHTKLWYKFSTLLVSSLNLTISFWSRSRIVEYCFCRCNAGFNFILKSCIFYHQSTE